MSREFDTSGKAVPVDKYKFVPESSMKTSTEYVSCDHCGAMNLKGKVCHYCGRETK